MNQTTFLEDLTYDSDKFPEPRDFQKTARQKLREGFAAGHRCQMVMAPTGSGKTVLSMFLIRECLLRKRKALFVADRRTLINQTSAVADSLGLEAHSIIMADHWRYDERMPFQIASAQTLQSRGNWPDFDLAIYDEAHCQLSVLTEYMQKSKAAFIGLSATPFSKGLGNIYTNLVNAATMRELTEQGILVPMRVLSCTKINMVGAATSGGEWTDEAAGERGLEIVGDIVQEWIKYGENRKTFVFGATIAHCEAIVRDFNNAGIMAAAFTADTTDTERKQIWEGFEGPDCPIRVIASVDALAKGVDKPDVSCLCDARPLRKSLSTAMQIWGRMLRACPKIGKVDALLLDFSGNIVRFAEDFENIYHYGLDKLDDGEVLDKAIRKDKEEEPGREKKGCPGCGYKPFTKRCCACGFEIVKENFIEHEAGEMKEFFVGKKSVGGQLSVWEGCVNHCRSTGNAATSIGRAKHLYQSIVGKPPAGLPPFDSVKFGPVPREIANKAKSNMIAFLHSKKAAR